jgi:hypothetical protein
MEVIVEIYDTGALLPEIEPPIMHSIWDWVGPRTGLAPMMDRKISPRTGNLNIIPGLSNT